MNTNTHAEVKKWEREKQHLQRQKSNPDNLRINATWKLKDKNLGTKKNNNLIKSVTTI